MIIKNIKLINHQIFQSTTFKLSKDVNGSTNYKTVIIGPNGTGKSTILGIIAEALIIENAKNKKKGLGKINYGYEISIHDGRKEITLKSDNLSSCEAKLGKILAVSSNINDRYPFIRKNSDDTSIKYEYLGLKTASNNIFYSNTKDKLVENIHRICASEKRVKSVLHVLGLLKFSCKFSITISKGRYFNSFINTLFQNGYTGEIVVDSKSYSDNAYNNFVESKWLSTYVDEYRAIVSDIYVNENKCKKIDIDLSDVAVIARFTEDFTLIKQMIAAKIITISDVSLFANEGYDVYKASSGEFNILRKFIGILSRVENNSIILIDEPELSLHPNWQIDFISILDKSLSDYTGCHTIIATHSHFIISNANYDNTNIIALYPSSKSRHVYIQELDIDTYGWSPEHTLYRIFGVTGYRNKYFENDLRCIVDNISNNLKVTDEFTQAVKRISEYNITNNDMLYDIIERAKLKVAEMENVS